MNERKGNSVTAAADTEDVTTAPGTDLDVGFAQEKAKETQRPLKGVRTNEVMVSRVLRSTNRKLAIVSSVPHGNSPAPLTLPPHSVVRLWRFIECSS